MRTADFLVEVGTEELPPKALQELEVAFREQVSAGIGAAGLQAGPVTSFATPRRLAVLVRALALAQPVQAVEKRGPPVSVAFDAQGAPTRAALAFATTCGVPVDQLQRLETPKGSWLVFQGSSSGAPTTALLPGIVNGALAALPIPRRMRWGAGEAEFVRPVHWVLMLLGDQVVPGPILGLNPGSTTRGHRFLAPEPRPVANPADYEETLLGAKVVADFNQRRQRIRALVDAAAAEMKGRAVVDEALLDEVTALVEWPVPLVGRFGPEFLRLPEEVLIATLQGHQRYFPMRDQDRRLLPCFIATANIESRDPAQIRQGNERVVLPRLADAAFFWDQDRRTRLADRLPGLDSVVYQKGLGSLRQRSARIAELARTVAAQVGCDPAQAARAAELAKADLLSQLVGEFPELQGRMGEHYARHDGEPTEVAAAIGEQYLPRHAGDSLPATPAGRCLAVADRLDALAGVFALGKRPTGNKDPFGLRRAALGLFRILVEDQVDIDLPRLIAQAVSLQPVKGVSHDALAGEILAFIMDRARSWYVEGLAPGLPAGTIDNEMFEAVRLRAPASAVDFHVRLTSVRAFMQLPEAASLAAANKRIANILRGAEGVDGDPDPALFQAGEERNLHAALLRVMGHHGERLQRREYAAVLESLAGLRIPVDAFFNAVMVMADDARLRRNRLALLQRLRQLFLDVADLSCLSSPQG